MKNKIRFAVVEDDQVVCEALGNLLETRGDLRCVGLFTEAEPAEYQLPVLQPDVVLMDLQLGSDNGIELIRKLKPMMPKCQFMVITVFADSSRVFESLKAGATGYILKDADPDEYLNAMQILLAGGSPLSPRIARLLIESFRETPVPGLEQLTPRERQVLDLLTVGHSYKEVAAALEISIDTVRSHIRHLYEKLHVRSRGQAVNLLNKKQ